MREMGGTAAGEMLSKLLDGFFVFFIFYIFLCLFDLLV